MNTHTLHFSIKIFTVRHRWCWSMQLNSIRKSCLELSGSYLPSTYHFCVFSRNSKKKNRTERLRPMLCVHASRCMHITRRYIYIRISTYVKRSFVTDGIAKASHCCIRCIRTESAIYISELIRRWSTCTCIGLRIFVNNNNMYFCGDHISVQYLRSQNIGQFTKQITAHRHVYEINQQMIRTGFEIIIIMYENGAERRLEENVSATMFMQFVIMQFPFAPLPACWQAGEANSRKKKSKNGEMKTDRIGNWIELHSYFWENHKAIRFWISVSMCVSTGGAWRIPTKLNWKHSYFRIAYYEFRAKKKTATVTLMIWLLVCRMYSSYEVVMLRPNWSYLISKFWCT